MHWWQFPRTIYLCLLDSHGDKFDPLSIVELNYWCEAFNWKACGASNILKHWKMCPTVGSHLWKYFTFATMKIVIKSMIWGPQGKGWNNITVTSIDEALDTAWNKFNRSLLHPQCSLTLSSKQERLMYEDKLHHTVLQDSNDILKRNIQTSKTYLPNNLSNKSYWCIKIDCITKHCKLLTAS